MSFIDLATLTMHRRTELEVRLNVFYEKCDRAVDDINKLKMKTQSFPLELNCEPSELKDRFLQCMKQLDEYMYLITDFNLALSRNDDKTVIEYTPVHDTSTKPVLLTPLPPFNLMDALSEPAPSTSTACSNNCPPEKPKRVKTPKDQTLIAFSSTSSSEETVMQKSKVLELCEEVKEIKIEEAACESSNLPGQEILDTEQSYSATIMHIDGMYVWLITDEPDELHDLVMDMSRFYSKKHKAMSTDEVRSLACCAFYDDESDCYYRGLFVKLLEEDNNMCEIFMVDAGDLRSVPLPCVQPLYKQFCDKPPFARCCHLAGVDMMINNNNNLMHTQEEFMKKYIGTQCTIAVDDNSSETVGVYVMFESGETLNAMLVQQGLALLINTSVKEEPIPEDEEIDITQCPEYEDPVEAVTGYSNRDEADICKHYKGGPEKTCFKGARCTKKHILKHPDGWTLDRVEITERVRALPLPAPGTWHRALVTNVCHFDRVYVQLITNDKEEMPKFGVVLPPTTLAGLVRDMNSPVARMAYKPLLMRPSIGEMLAALYPPDNNWYRAKVLNISMPEQCIEVMYVDYGTVLWVKEDQVRALDPRHISLPIQAICCKLAGVEPTTKLSSQWAQAKVALSSIAMDKKVNLHVIAREYEELVVEAIDEDGFSIAEKLAATKLVELKKYKVAYDSAITKKIVVP